MKFFLKLKLPSVPMFGLEKYSTPELPVAQPIVYIDGLVAEADLNIEFNIEGL